MGAKGEGRGSALPSRQKLPASPSDSKGTPTASRVLESAMPGFTKEHDYPVAIPERS